MDGITDRVFSGGNLTQKSGGTGPDAYLFRRLARYPWVIVIIRTNAGRDAYQADLEALAFILKYRQEADRLTPGRAQSICLRTAGLLTMSASAFVEAYGQEA